MAFLAYKGGRIHYTDCYSKKYAVVLLHGFLESSTMWNNFALNLSKTYRVITVDLPGHGKTDCFGYVHDMEIMAQAVQAVLKHLKVRKAILIGHSMGGYAALAFADLFPDSVKGLCLFHSTAYADSESKQNDRIRAAALVKENAASFIRKAIPNLFRPKNRKIFAEAVKSLKEEALQTSVQGIIAAIEGMRLRKNRDLILAFSPYPKAMIIGEFDKAVNYNDSIEQLGLNQEIQSLILPIGHMGFIEDPYACLKFIRKFLRSCTTKTEV